MRHDQLNDLMRVRGQYERGDMSFSQAEAELRRLGIPTEWKRTERCPHGVHPDNRCERCD